MARLADSKIPRKTKEEYDLLTLEIRSGAADFTKKTRAFQLSNRIEDYRKAFNAAPAASESHKLLERARMIASPPRPPSNRDNWWSVMYNKTAPSSIHDWSQEVIGIRDRTVTNDGFDARITTDPTIPRITFENCDFRGTFQSPQENRTVTLKEFEFSGCCFSSTLWRRIKFQDCKFTQCDLSFTRFEDCIFTEKCAFSSLSISAAHTTFHNTSICASQFLASPTTNTESIPPGKSTPQYQVARLASTVAKVAHTILHSTRQDPNPAIFFDAYKAYVRASKRKEIRENIYRITTMREIQDHPVTGAKRVQIRLKGALMLPIRLLDAKITDLSGFLNNWGESLLRPVVFAGCVALAFSVIYWFIDPKISSWWDSLLMSIDITLVAGYSKYLAQEPRWINWLLLTNLTFGIFWYSIFVPTLLRHTMRG